jgi:hypothetical protein
MVFSFMLLGISLHIAQQVAPLLALWGQGLVAYLKSGFPGMAGAAKHLQIAQRIGKFGVRSDG